MKFLYFGDLHERETTPEHRVDDFQLTLDNKITEIRELGEKHQVRAFLQPGDFLDKPKLSHEFLSTVVQRWGFSDLQQHAFNQATSSEKKSEGTPSYRPIIGAIGNHELYGNALRSYPKTSLSLLEEIGFMHIPKENKPIIFKDSNGFSVAITAGHYDTKMDDPSMLDVYIVKEKLADFHIHIVHGYLTNKDMGDLFLHTTVDMIAKKTKADLTISGHDHIGFDEIEVDGKWFVNPGSIIRLTNDLKEVKRKPKVLLIEVNKETGVSLQSIDLKSAEDGKHVLDRSHTAFKKSMGSKMEEIKSLVQKSQVGSGLSITDIIKAISDSKQLDEDLKNRAIDLVTKKMNSATNNKTQVDDYYIKRIVLENFQSHKYSEYELEEGLNVFVGKSSSGKSSVQRALAWVYENEGRNPRRFITNGEAFTKVHLYLSNGLVITRFVEKKQGGKNGYEIYDPKTGDVTEYNTKGLPIVQELLGFSDLWIDDRKSIPLNFQKQGASWFFIGDGYTNSDRAKIIGAVYQTHYVDAVIKELESKSKKTRIQMRGKLEDLEDVEEEIKKYQHLPQLKSKIETIEERLKAFEKLEERYLVVKKLTDEEQQIEKKIEEELLTIEKFKDIHVLESKVQSIENRMVQMVRIKKKDQHLDNLRGTIEEQKQIFKQYQDVDQWLMKWETIHNKLVETKQLQKVIKKSDRLIKNSEQCTKQIETTEKTIQSLANLTDIEERLEDVRTEVEIVKQVKPLISRLDKLEESCKRGESYINQLMSKHDSFLRSYKISLESIGSCPICKSDIDDEIIMQITESYQFEEE